MIYMAFRLISLIFLGVRFARIVKWAVKFTKCRKDELYARAIAHVFTFQKDPEFQRYDVASTYNPSLATVLVAICTISSDTN